MAEQYGAVDLPARVRKPRDKAPVENAILPLQCFLLGRQRNRRFFSLAEINESITDKLEVFTERPIKGYSG